MTTRNGNRYEVPARLVHWLLISIIGAIVSIGGYMVAWAINDAAVNASRDAALRAVSRRVQTWEDRGVLDEADERLHELEQWRREVDERHRGDDLRRSKGK